MRHVQTPVHRGHAHADDTMTQRDRNRALETAAAPCRGKGRLERQLQACDGQPRTNPFPGTVVRVAASALVLLALSPLTLPAPVHAAEVEISEDGSEIRIEELPEVFQNNIARGRHFCLIALQNPGVLGVNPDATEIGSRSFGGNPGTVVVSASNSGFEIVVDEPLGFSRAPKDAHGGLVMKTSYLGNGASSFSEKPGGIPQKIKKGDTTIDVHLSATRNGMPFPAGDYSAEITIRCE